MILRESIMQFDTEVLDYLDRDATLPVVSVAACQGDVSIFRANGGEAVTPVPAAGVPVVRGEAGGNTHSLHAIGPVFFDFAPARSTGLAIGTLTVPEGSTAVLLHPEHGGLVIEPGTYRVGRQREMADEIRMVQD
jgi:hypothetical protein